jgi:lysyl-tRNA synthetase class 2
VSEGVEEEAKVEEADELDDRESRQAQIPYSFPGTVPAGAIARDYEALEPGGATGVVVRVAGRVMRNRPQGKVSFAELRDWSGAIQLFATAALTADFAEFVRLNLGDWVGVEGEIIRTRRGELSVQVATWSLLAEARRGFGDKWRGINDVEVRHRQREVDLWANEGVRDNFLFRSAVVRSIRRQLDERGFIEVETPVLQPLAGGANARPFVTHYESMHADYYLRIATELYLKRLVVGGFERVYEIGKTFRNEGLSPKHNPEFTMLEAYQAYVDYGDLATLVEDMVASIASELLGTTIVSTDVGEIDLKPPWRRATLESLVEEVTSLRCTIEMSREELAHNAGVLGLEVDPSWGAGRILAEIYEAFVEHALIGPVHVMDYPEEVSPLSRRHRSRPGLVERLTPVVAGREIGEVYSELVDPDDQRRRFQLQAAQKRAGDEDAMALDEDFLRALEHGMPPTGGLGIGIDRLVMLLSGNSNIREVILFPALRATDRGIALTGVAQDDEDADEDAPVDKNASGQVPDIDA